MYLKSALSAILKAGLYGMICVCYNELSVFRKTVCDMNYDDFTGQYRII
jgi:hypothetical protein